MNNSDIEYAMNDILQWEPPTQAQYEERSKQVGISRTTAVSPDMHRAFQVRALEFLLHDESPDPDLRETIEKCITRIRHSIGSTNITAESPSVPLQQYEKTDQDSRHPFPV
jgi:hypothetical protein